MGTGYDNIDIAAARERNIPVTFAPDILTETTADGVFALLLAAARRLGEAERFLRAGKFRGWTPFMFTGRDVNRSEEHTSELQSHSDIVCRPLLDRKKLPRGCE